MWNPSQGEKPEMTERTVEDLLYDDYNSEPELEGDFSESDEEVIDGSTKDVYDDDDDDDVRLFDRSDHDLEDPDCSEPPTFSGYVSSHRDRSRSPIIIRDLGVHGCSRSAYFGNILGIYDEDDTSMEDLGEDFMTADAHDLYVSAEEEKRVERLRSPAINIVPRGSNRARGGRRGHSVRGSGRCPLGHPLTEIWVTDDDVPTEMREMAREVVRRRQENITRSVADGRDESLMEAEDLPFEWSPMESFRGEEETFRPVCTGSVASHSTPYEAFRAFWDDDILQVIVKETNRYACQIQSASFQAEWYPTDIHEVLCLFAFWMMSGIIRLPTICSHFSQSYLLKTEVFSRITTLKRYIKLNRALCFVDTSDAAYPTTSDATRLDPLLHLSPIIEHLNSKFKANYILSKDICIDQSPTLWKGTLSFRPDMPTKGAKFGIKTFELCESATGYLWSFLLYTGKYGSNGLHLSLLKSTALVQKLIKPLLNKGYRLFMGNWFNSPLLARYLKRNGTDCVGTLCSNRQHVPRVITKAPLQQGQFIARHSGDVCILSWQEKSRINMISTCHGSRVGLSTVPSKPPSRPLPFKPQAVLDYNKSMGGVELKDQMLEPYLLELKRGKWYVKLFKRFINASIQNARILLGSCLKDRQDNLKFRLALVQTILEKHLPLVTSGRRAEAARHRTVRVPHIVDSTHWPVAIPPSPSEAKRNRKGRLECEICLRSQKRTMTHYRCEDCEVPLCIEPCFRIYHTVV